MRHLAIRDPEHPQTEDQVILVTVSSLPHHKVVAPSAPSHPDDYNCFQDLLRRIADSCAISHEEVQESSRKILDTLHSSTPVQVELLLNEALMDLKKKYITDLSYNYSMSKDADTRYQVPSTIMEYLYTHSVPASLTVGEANERNRQQKPRMAQIQKNLIDSNKNCSELACNFKWQVIRRY